MRLLNEVCSLPTAPFVEQHVVQYIETFVKSRKKLRLSRDQFGNLLVTLPGRAKSLPRLVYTAHMDHPGLISTRMIDANTSQADFRGGVLIEFVRCAKVIFFDGAKQIKGTVIDATPTDTDRKLYPGRCIVSVKENIKPGLPGMFDLGAGRFKGKRFFSRVIDDLGGLAAALQMLDKLHKSPPKSTVALLCTRAEEDGFIGAIAASLHPALLKKSDRIIAIECSAKQIYAPQGDGVIIRAGDRTSIFNSALTYWMTQQAEAMKKKRPAFKYQRALMPGGTCEATVYDVYGFTAAAVCIALGNYHNMDREKKKLAPEYIDTRDWKSMVDLFMTLSKNAHEFDPANPQLKARLTKRFDKLKHLFKS